MPISKSINMTDLEMTKVPGRSLAVQYIDATAASNPSRLICLVPKGKDPRDGFYNVTFQHFARAVDYLAWHLESQLGRKHEFQCFGFLSHPADFRYQILAIVAMKIGWTAFFPSPRNTLPGFVSLLGQADCRAWLVNANESINPIVTEMSKHHPLQLVDIPNERFFLENDFTNMSPSYPYPKTFDEGRNDVFLTLHTSGSTGIPKIVQLRQHFLTVQDALKDGPTNDTHFKYFEGLSMFIPLPWFHVAPFALHFGCNMRYNVTTITAPVGQMSTHLVDLYHQFANVDMTVTAPTILKEIAYNETYAQHCSSLKYIGNGGGPSTPEVGRILSKYTYPINMAGSTEASIWPTKMLQPENYAYFSFDPRFGTDFRPLDDIHYELWLKRTPATEPYQAPFSTFPELQEWSTKDVFTKHPTEPDLWKLVGRTDDVVVLSSGLKVNSVDIEGAIGNHAQITGVVVFGAAQIELGLLLEVTQEIQSLEVLRNTIRPLLQEVNSKTVVQGRIAEDMIIMASPDKPFPRAAKGTIQKRMCLKLYEKEIEQMFLDRTRTANTAGLQPPLRDGPEGITDFLENWIVQNMGVRVSDRNQDLFEVASGMDSLSIVRLARALNLALPEAQVLPQTIYENPTIHKLAAVLADKTSSRSTTEVSREQRMEAYFNEFANDLPINSRPPALIEDKQLVIAVTGTTGSLGSYILDRLLTSTSGVKKVYCLNRRPDADVVQKRLQETNGLSQELGDRTKFLQIDVAKPRLGLERGVYTELLQEVDIIIHNAWDVNFNKSLESFKPQIHAVRRFIDMCALSRKRASLHFISSIATVQNWRYLPDEKAGANGNGSEVAQHKVPEEILKDWTVSVPTGYGESKHISECLLARACEESNVPVSIYRVGQVAGPIQQPKYGQWQKHEWVPVMIQTSIAINKFPSDLGPMNEIDWVPVDVVGETVAELALHNNEHTQQQEAQHDPQIYHIVNPRTTEWPALLPGILKSLPTKPQPSIVSLAEWVETVRAAGSQDESRLQELTALRLMPFFEGLSLKSSDDGVRLDTKLTCANSKVLSSLESVQPEWIDVWMQQWAFSTVE